MKKNLSQTCVQGKYTISAIHCSYDEAQKLQRLGIFEGEDIVLIKNHPKDSSLVIESMDANFVLDREIAKGIEVTEMKQ